MWTLHLSEVEAGLYTMRVDEVDAAGKVLSRVETPFKRETRERVAEAQAQAQAEVETQNAQVEEPAEDQPVVETEQTAVAEEDLAEAASSTTGDDTNVADEDVAGAESEIGEASSVAETTTETEVEPAPPAKQPAVRIVTVQPGSTLWAIARDRYGEGTMYVQVFEANKDKIRDPDLIYPGQVFTIPE
ncbi:MAG: LysM peptidoglycan-binding domain-containing protein [Shimia sp.]|nr:LysM peptidoglycan-binding domain-containing protein [Shimia sp.]